MSSKILLTIAATTVGVLLTSASASAQTYSDLVLADNPLFYWNFDEPGDADAAIDLVGADAGDNLLPEGNATRVSSGTTLGGLPLGRAASFDGTQFTKFFSGALTPATSPDAWAVEMWVRPQGDDPGDRFDYLLEARGPGNAPGILFDYGNNNVIEVFRGGQRTAGAGPTLSNDAWSHLVIGNFGAANDRVDFWLDGALTGSVVFAGDSPFGTEAIAVGNSVPGDPNFDHFNGQIDELAVYDLTGLNVLAIPAKLAAIAGHAAAVPEPSALLLVVAAAPMLRRLRRGC